MGGITIRKAELGDLPRIIKLLSEDILGSGRETYSDPPHKRYIDAFNDIAADKNSVLLVVCEDEEVVGNLQITFTRYLSHMGALRATVENVRVAADKRGSGIGTKLMNYAIDLARDKGCSIVQLTSDKSRKDAHRFYRRLGFESAHEGMKLSLEQA